MQKTPRTLSSFCRPQDTYIFSNIDKAAVRRLRLEMKAVPVAQTCRLLGVSRAGFYEARRRAA
jgi:hypothetical protein